jgi:hypothetical protein
MEAIGVDSGGKINMAYIERLISLFATLWLGSYAEV